MIDSPAAAPTAHDPKGLAAIAARIAERAAARILELRAQGVDVAASKSSATDVVTAADQESERLIVAAIQDVRPDDGILGEEGTGIAGTSGITWVIDPIDGTVNYLYDLPAYSVSIAATVADETAYGDGRRAIAGAVCNPRTDELFVAWEGGGATRNGEPIRITGQDDLSLSLVATGFGYTAERRTEQAEMVARVIPRARDIRRYGSAAYDLCMLAAGRLDAYYEQGLQPWDYAAGVLIASEAGATLIGRDAATPPGESFMVVGAAGLVEELRSLALGE
ncbi:MULTISPECIES: inositol monophosphatase family protein [Leucobacter]|uniref:Inositol-1-monophosphatase n=1 Tax=Leucobacter manosquensis TaxID=2810611 RepID=A0ABS5M0K5_9MICO|nr:MULTISPECIES: inositol monophosphatase family protein [Leucobacter]MBS3180724.1 inositol monophosphatase [Leucobacter manosquensis]